MTQEARRRRALLMLDGCHAGEVLRIYPSLIGLRAGYPEWELSVLVSEPAAQLFADHKLFDNVVVSRLYEQRSHAKALLILKKSIQLVGLAFRLGRGYDTVVIYWWGWTILQLLARWVGGHTVGFATRWPRLLSVALACSSAEADELQRSVSLLRAAGLAPLTHVADTDGTPDIASAARLLGELGLATDDDFAILHPGSDWPCQQWLPERWAALATCLVNEFKLQVIFTGAAHESAQVEAIRGQAQCKTFSLAGRTDLATLGGLLRKASLCVCVDSAPYEIAQMVGAPTVVVAGATEAQRLSWATAPAKVVNRTPTAAKNEIRASQWLRFSRGEASCANYGCPLAWLVDVTVQDVVKAVSEIYTRSPNVAATTHGAAGAG